jgi:uncharacterized protein YqeY
MSLQSQIREDMLAAMKSRDTEVVSLLRVVAGEFGREMNNGIELPDDRVLAILRKMSENAIELGNQGEVEILDKYLPKMLGEQQIKTLVGGIIQTNKFSGMQDMGKVMGEIKKHPAAAQIDGKIASQLVRELLSK